ncbi:lipopolysaccharide biosynthesis protein [Streptococcus orisratti]|uniref:lipopolysaccharide biosynthesis protein n=1 Tax=Streptococcus orisratti TaxID=114652 RepID=UPI000374E895|nr:lipopolysaccharide biosynthesis protein [Streptococcus orisratti]
MIKTQTSPQKIFFWNMMGSLSSALISVFLLMVVSRVLSTLDSDIYAFAYSLGNMLVVVGLFQVRNFQATDITQKYSFSEYFLVRLITCFAMMAIAVAYLALTDYDAYKSQVIFYITLYRASDAFSDLYQGLFQQHERLDIAGKSLSFRNAILSILFTIVVVLTHRLLLAIQLVCLVSFVFILFYDVRKSLYFDKIAFRQLSQLSLLKDGIKLMKESLPLFLNGFLLIYIYNEPKYALDALTGLGKVELGSQTIFNILFMPAFVMNLMMLFFRPLITQMAIYISKKQLADFRKLQIRLFFYLFGAGLLVLLGSALLGIPFLSFLYGIKLSDYWVAFMLIMVGGAVGSFSTAIDNILTAMRCQNYLLIPYVGSFCASLLMTNHLVASYQILGASLSFVLTMLIWLILSIAVYLFTKKKVEKGDL